MADVVRYKLFLNNNKTIVEIFQREVGKTQRYMYIPADLTSKADAQTICDIITNGGNIANACVYDIINGGNTYYFKWKVVESLKRAEASVFEDVQDFLRSSTKATPTITASNTSLTPLNPFLFKKGDTFEDTNTGNTWKIVDILKSVDIYVVEKGISGGTISVNRNVFEADVSSGKIKMIFVNQPAQPTNFKFQIGDKFEQPLYGIEWEIIDIVDKWNEYLVKKTTDPNKTTHIIKEDFEKLVEEGRIKQITTTQPTQNVTFSSNKLSNQSILDELKNVKKGDVIKIIRKKDGSIFQEVRVIDARLGQNGWYIKVDNKGTEADLYFDYWEVILEKNDFEVQIIKKGQSQAQAQPFKVGDKVLLSKDSEYYKSISTDANPKDTIGTIISFDKSGILVKWENTNENYYGEEDLELVTTQQTQVPSVGVLPVYCLRSGFRKIGYIKDVIGEIDSFTGARRWKVYFADGTNTLCYRIEFFVEGDILELHSTKTGGESTILVSKITDYEISGYNKKLGNVGFSDTLEKIAPSQLLGFEIKVVDPIDDIASVAALNPDLNQQQAKPTIYAVDTEWKDVMEVVSLEQKMTSQKDDYWVLYHKKEDESYTQNRRNFFVEGDIVKFTYRKDKTSILNARIEKIYPVNESIDWLNIDDNFVGEFYINGLFDDYIVEIVEFYNLRELFDQPILVPKEDISSTPIVPSKTILDEIDQAKKDLGQLLFMRNLLSPIDFEQKIEVTQLIDEKQRLINELNFKGIEEKMAKDQFFDDLFEQSFTTIQHQYEDIYNITNQEIDFFTPNGARTQLSFEINEIIRTPQFKEWFGDWELAYIYKDADALELDCSKVLTQNFEPRVVWHGTGKEFSYFIFDNFPAAYFAVNREYSQFFADLQGGGDGYVIPFFLNIRNPLDLTHFNTNMISSKDFFDYMYLMTGLTMEQLDVNPIFLTGSTPLLETWMYIRNNPKMLKKIAETKIYDGIHFYETNPNVTDVTSPAHKTEAYITFSADQCKIADPNRGMLLFASLKSFLLEKGGKI
jgi:hypothetical protein